MRNISHINEKVSFDEILNGSFGNYSGLNQLGGRKEKNEGLLNENTKIDLKEIKYKNLPLKNDREDKNDEFEKENKEKEKIRRSMLIYSNEDVFSWKKLYETYGNLITVSKKIGKIKGKLVPHNTIKRRLKEVLMDKFEHWYDKYQLSGKYSWEDIRLWKIKYENLHNFGAIEEYIKENIDPNGPHEDTIRKCVKKYLSQILETDYDKWLEKHHERKPYKYEREDYLHWKELYEELGSLKDVRERLRNEKNDPPDAITIRNGLKSILGDKYEEWKNKFARKTFEIEEIEEWKRLYEKYGSIGKVSDLTGHDAKAMKKHLNELLGKKFNDWYEKHYVHHSIKYTDNEIADWKSLFEELGSFPAVSAEIEPILRKYISPSVIRKTVKKYLGDKGINYNNWLNEFSLSDNIVDIGKKIHQIIEYYFMVNFRSTDAYIFYEITPSMEIDDLFRIDNSIIYPQSAGISLFGVNIVNIDYLFSTNPARLYPKMYKNYHSKEMLLLIVTLTAKLKGYSIPLDVPYKKNIKIIDIDDFFKIFTFDISIEQKIRDAIKLAKKAPYSPNAYEELKNLAKSANKQLKFNFGNRKDQQKNFNQIYLRI